MPSHQPAGRSAAQPPGRGPVDALISQTRRLKGDVDAVRRDTPADGSDPRGRWQRALYDLALYQLDDLDEHLAQLRDGPLPVPADSEAAWDTPSPGSLLSRVGSAEWNLRTDEARWSAEFYDILGRDPAAPPLTLDELPSVVPDTDRPKLTTMVTGCLVDARPIDGEFRVVRPDGDVRTVHMMGEPVLAADGSTVSMWAVLRDVSELRRRRRAVSETRDSLPPRGNRADAGHGFAVEPRGAVPKHGSPRLPHRDTPGLDLAAHRLPATTSGLAGGDWCDTLGLPDGETLLGVGDLAGHGVAVTSGVTMLLGAVRGMAMAGTRPGRLLELAEELLLSSAQPDLAGAVCCRYRPSTRTLVWAHAGRPAPLLFRAGTGRALTAPGSGASPARAEAEETLQAGDLLLLHTEGLLPPGSATAAADRLLGLAPLLTRADNAQDCVRMVAEEFAGTERETGAWVLAARVPA
ncbi:PP2C family protein-serine/threonine phosphatase [Streptomyces sp. DH24]|uniref:PP2C family protein-serine/threonine phosphatase n=1 Tax=Streptomyces sp. DH24 TaxID=3040123 RepID=UPI002441225A|nr:SpoIIE family protein phosphatase [Streptomyces sp. DH24]MDG9717994.1 SpoIIE family protein phosphatase [Streptomyces sp. DH24]